MNNSNFLEAAASFYGLAEAPLRKTELFTDAGQVVLAFELVPSDEDMAGIVARMQNMQALEKARAQPQDLEPILPTDERMRAEYGALDPRDKSAFGAFARYKAWRLGQVMDEVIAGPAEEAVDSAQALADLPPHVYLQAGECTPLQRAMALGQDEKGRYAVAVEDLTPEQHFARFATEDEKALAEADNTAAAIAARIAGDFGGLPG